MRRFFAIFVAFVLAGSVSAEDVEWRPAEPILTNVLRNGDMVETAPALDWSSRVKEPAAKLGPLLPPLRPAPEGTERPLPLPDKLTDLAGPTLPSPKSKPILIIPTAEPPRRVRESFASESQSVPLSAPTPVREFTPAKVSVEPSPPPPASSRPQPWAPRPGQRTIFSEIITRTSR